MASEERRQADIELAALGAKFEGFISLVSEKFSALEASVNLLRVGMDRLELRGDSACGKCRGEIAKELEDVWHEVKKIRDSACERLDALEKAAGNAAKKVFVFIASTVGAIILAGVVALVGSWIKGA